MSRPLDEFEEFGRTGVSPGRVMRRRWKVLSLGRVMTLSGQGRGFLFLFRAVVIVRDVSPREFHHDYRDTIFYGAWGREGMEGRSIVRAPRFGSDTGHHRACFDTTNV